MGIVTKHYPGHCSAPFLNRRQPLHHLHPNMPSVLFELFIVDNIIVVADEKMVHNTKPFYPQLWLLASRLHGI